MNPQIDTYLAEGCGRCELYRTPQCKVHTWQPELRALRSLVLACGLTEELKWSQPCYTYQGKNILILAAFKDYAFLSFFKGSLLKDTHHLLYSPGKSSQAARLLRFTEVATIGEQEAIIKAYIYEAIEVEKAGLKVEFKKNPEPIPVELKEAFEADPELKAAFEGLPPGRQRGYVLYFSQPKQVKTRVGRIEKYREQILAGVGLQDGYRRRGK